MTDDEVRQIVNEIFSPKKITCIQRHKREESITYKIYTDWNDGEKEYTVADELTLFNPLNNSNSIQVAMSLKREDFTKFKQFCAAKGMIPWLKNNPYLQEKTNNTNKF